MKEFQYLLTTIGPEKTVRRDLRDPVTREAYFNYLKERQREDRKYIWQEITRAQLN